MSRVVRIVSYDLTKNIGGKFITKSCKERFQLVLISFLVQQQRFSLRVAVWGTGGILSNSCSGKISQNSQKNICDGVFIKLRPRCFHENYAKLLRIPFCETLPGGSFQHLPLTHFKPMFPYGKSRFLLAKCMKNTCGRVTFSCICT